MSDTEKRYITKDDLVLFVPFFLVGETASKLEEKSLVDVLSCRTMVMRRELAVSKITDLSSLLISKEIHKMISTSHLRNREDLFNILFAAAVDGLRRGLRKFDTTKMNVSATNYLFQWITTYARKELNALEAPFGVPPSRFLVFKKISAVRKKLSAELMRDATDEEVLEYFHGGRADIETMNGRVANRGKPSQANQNINLELVREQGRFEREMLTVDLVDTTDSLGQVQFSTTTDAKPFAETFFSAFLENYPFTPEAKAVLKNELNYDGSLSPLEQHLLSTMNSRRYSLLNRKWKKLMMAKNGIFAAFLRDNLDSDFNEFDVVGTLALVTSAGIETPLKAYSELLET